jgi:hypothetical protein
MFEADADELQVAAMAKVADERVRIRRLGVLLRSFDLKLLYQNSSTSMMFNNSWHLIKLNEF